MIPLVGMVKGIVVAAGNPWGSVFGRLPKRNNHNNFTTDDLRKWIKAYVLFDKLDRHAGDVVLKLMDELEAGSSVVRVQP
jgi:hypothetical protein